MSFINLYKFGIIQLILSTILLVTGCAMYFIASDIMSSQIHKVFLQSLNLNTNVSQ